MRIEDLLKESENLLEEQTPVQRGQGILLLAFSYLEGRAFNQVQVKEIGDDIVEITTPDGRVFQYKVNVIE